MNDPLGVHPLLCKANNVIRFQLTAENSTSEVGLPSMLWGEGFLSGLGFHCKESIGTLDSRNSTDLRKILPSFGHVHRASEREAPGPKRSERFGSTVWGSQNLSQEGGQEGERKGRVEIPNQEGDGPPCNAPEIFAYTWQSLTRNYYKIHSLSNTFMILGGCWGHAQMLPKRLDGHRALFEGERFKKIYQPGTSWLGWCRRGWRECLYAFVFFVFLTIVLDLIMDFWHRQTTAISWKDWGEFHPNRLHRARFHKNHLPAWMRHLATKRLPLLHVLRSG